MYILYLALFCLELMRHQTADMSEAICEISIILTNLLLSVYTRIWRFQKNPSKMFRRRVVISSYSVCFVVLFGHLFNFLSGEKDYFPFKTCILHISLRNPQIIAISHITSLYITIIMIQKKSLNVPLNKTEKVFQY